MATAVKIVCTYFDKRRQLNNNASTPSAAVELFHDLIHHEKTVDPGVDMDLLIVNNRACLLEEKYLYPLDGEFIYRGQISSCMRDNIGGSFGAYIHSFNLVKDLNNVYDYIMFSEDDVIFFHDGYYKAAIDLLDKDPRLGFAAFSPISTDGHPVHCGGGLGVTKTSIMREVHSDTSYTGTTYKNFEQHEVDFTNKFIRAGYKIENIPGLNPFARNYRQHISQSYHVGKNPHVINNGQFIYRVGKDVE